MSTVTAAVLAPPRTYRYAGGFITMLVTGEETGGHFALMEALQRPGAEPPLHIHKDACEMFHVIEGVIDIYIDGVIRRLGPGETALVPRGTPHTFRIRTDYVRGLVGLTPAGLEEWFTTAGIPTDEYTLSEDVAKFDQRCVHLMAEMAPRLQMTVLPDQVVF